MAERGPGTSVLREHVKSSQYMFGQLAAGIQAIINMICCLDAYKCICKFA